MRPTSVWPQYKGFRKLILDHEMKFEIGFDVLDSTTTMMILRSRQERESREAEQKVIHIKQSLPDKCHLVVATQMDYCYTVNISDVIPF